MSEPTDWHLICVTRKGKVSILKNLDLRTARETYKKLLPWERPKKYISHPCTAPKQQQGYGIMRDVLVESSWSHDSDTADGLKRIEPVGPEGEELNPWFGVKKKIINEYCHCGCRNKPSPVEQQKADTILAAAIAGIESHMLTPLPTSMADQDAKRRRDLYKHVPTAFWLAEETHA